jgi:hypothetical protein
VATQHPIYTNKSHDKRGYFGIIPNNEIDLALLISAFMAEARMRRLLRRL